MKPFGFHSLQLVLLLGIITGVWSCEKSRNCVECVSNKLCQFVEFGNRHECTRKGVIHTEKPRGIVKKNSGCFIYEGITMQAGEKPTERHGLKTQSPYSTQDTAPDPPFNYKATMTTMHSPKTRFQKSTLAEAESPTMTVMDSSTTRSQTTTLAEVESPTMSVIDSPSTRSQSQTTTITEGESTIIIDAEGTDQTPLLMDEDRMTASIFSFTLPHGVSCLQKKDSLERKMMRAMCRIVIIGKRAERKGIIFGDNFFFDNNPAAKENEKCEYLILEKKNCFEN